MVVPELRFGRQLERAVSTYLQQWRGVLPPMIGLLALQVAAALCCFVPVLIVGGPASVGLFSCAFDALDGRDPSDLWPRIRARLAEAIVAGLLLALIGIGIVSLLYATQYAIFSVIFALAGSLFATGSTERAFGFALAGIATFYVLALLLRFVTLVAGLWLGARLVFVLPLVADRGVSAVDAFTTSWAASRDRVLDLMLLLLLAAVIASLGAYLLGIGVVLTAPVAVFAVAAAYRDVFDGGDDSGAAAAEASAAA